MRQPREALRLPQDNNPKGMKGNEIDLAYYRVRNIRSVVFDQIKKASPTPEEEKGYYRIIDLMLEKNPEVDINNIEDIVPPEMPPALPGSDRAKTGVVRAANIAALRKEEVSGSREIKKPAGNDVYHEGMTLQNQDVQEITEVEARRIEAELKAKIVGYDTKKSKAQE